MIENATLERVYDEVKGDFLDTDEVRATVNDFILTHLRDCFAAGKPRLIMYPIAPVFNVPILLSYPDRALGEVGEVAVHALTGEVLGWTPLLEVEKNAVELRAAQATD
ncbi:MAG: hypothetical protein M3347_11335 [Armatimonadota bacterium]|nr:hypothetical protein [Armatimonadota bacterium]